MTNISAFDFLLSFLKNFIIFVLTAIAEIVGCYLPWLVFKEGKSFSLLIPSVFSLGVFVWLLMLHPTSAGRTYAAYGGVYIAVAIVWLRFVEGIRPNLSDIIGSFVALMGMAIIIYGSRV